MRRMEGSPQGRVHCPKWSHHSSHNRRNLCNMRSQSDLFKQCTKISYLMMEALCFAHIQKSCYSGFLFVWMCSVWFCLLCWLKFLIVWRRPASPSRREGSGAVFTDKSPSPSTVWLTVRSPNPSGCQPRDGDDGRCDVHGHGGVRRRHHHGGWRP